MRLCYENTYNGVFNNNICLYGILFCFINDFFDKEA